MRWFAIGELAIRSMIFAFPTMLMAWWCDIPPTWKLVAFMLFCSFWSACVFDGWKSSAKDEPKNDSSEARPRKPATDVMTPAQVAEAAHKTMRKQGPELES